MATLPSDVAARYDEQHLRTLTNPQDSDAKGPDHDRIDIAAADVEADFRILCGVVYDPDDPRHVTVAVRGVIAKLKSRLGDSEQASAAVTSYETAMKGLYRVTGGRRFKVKSSSRTRETREDEIQGQPARPRFDRRNFLESKPKPPR